MRLARLIIRLEERKLLEDSEEILSHCLQLSRIMFQHVTTLSVCACHECSPSIAPIGDAKKAVGEGKRGPVSTGLTGLVAMALYSYVYNGKVPFLISMIISVLIIWLYHTQSIV